MKNKELLSLFSAVSLGWAAITSTPALAANQTMLELLKVLRDNGTITGAAYKQLLNAAKADDEKDPQGQAEVKSAAPTLPKIETKGKLEWSTPEGDFKWRLGGRIHADAAFYSNDEGTTRTTTLASGTDIRRARLALEATLWRSWLFKVEYDFATSGEVDQGLRDFWLGYLLKGPQPFKFMIGQFKEFLGLESFYSANDLTFIERALPSRAFSPPDARRLGVGVSTYGYGLWTVGVGVFGKNASGEDIGGIKIGQDASDPLVFTGRLTFSPLHTGNRAVHLGFSGSWLTLSDDEVIRFRERPEAAIGADRLIETPRFHAEELVRYGAEAALVFGPFSLQGEYVRAQLSRALPRQPDVDFDGWYVYGSWVLTGESRGYEFEEGKFKNPKPNSIVGKGGIGAWEIAARYSTLDLSDEDILGGEEDNVTVGLNWYPTPNFKFMANYVKVLDLRGGRFDGAEPDIFEVRAQVYW